MALFFFFPGNLLLLLVSGLYSMSSFGFVWLNQRDHLERRREAALSPLTSPIPPRPVCRAKAGRVRPRPRLRWARGHWDTWSASADLCFRQHHLTCEVLLEASSSGPAPPPPDWPVWTRPSRWRSPETEVRRGLPGWSARCRTPPSRCRLAGLRSEQGHRVRQFDLAEL